MKSAHQEEAADKTGDRTGTKHIWIETVSTFDLKQRLNKRPCLVWNSQTVLKNYNVHRSWNMIPHCTQWHTGFK